MEIRFIWKEEYSVGVEEIDKQHQRFFQILEELYRAVLENQTKKQKGKIFQDLEDYVSVHFKTEEKYFDLFHYEEAEEHEAEHDKFMAKMEEFKKKEDVSFGLLDFLEDWLVNHLASVDQRYVECFKKNGLK
ncbi:MAG: bacteriohemerythrin [Patescibacteria group bacterium]